MKKNAMQLGTFILAYSLLYFVFSILIYFLSMSQNNNGINIIVFGGGDDGNFYYEQAKNIANNLPFVYTSIHAVIFGWVFKIFNTDSVFLLRFFNYLANLILIVISLLLLKKIMGNKQVFWDSSIILIVLLVLYPSLLLNTTFSLYRDCWIFVYYLWSIYLFSNIFIIKGKYPRIINIFVLIFTVFMLGGYRKYALLSFFVASVLYFLFIYKVKKRMKLKKIIIVSLAGFTLVYIFFRSYKVPYIGLSFQDVLSYRQSSLEAGGSQMGISLDHANIIYFYINYFYSVISNTIGPLPWQVNSVATLIVFFTESIIFIVIILFLYKQRKLFSELDLYLIIQSIIWFMLISISNDNLGTASRLRIVGWLPLIIVFSKYFGKYLFLRKQRKKAGGVLN